MGRKTTVLKSITALVLVIAIAPLQPNLHGGKYPRTDKSLWQLYQYKYTTMLQREPLSWCPFKSYLLVDKYVTVENRYNKNWLCINADLVKLTYSDASYNKAHAPRYKGKAKTKVRKIYNYCMATKYKIHVKSAKNVFKYRQGDCAAISEAFYVMCKRNRIPVRYVIGWCDGECHAWNRVKIGKKWYWIDATLGDYLSRKQFPNRSVLEIW